MKFYEVLLNLMKQGKKIGCVCVQLRANNPFMASVDAEEQMRGRYGEGVSCRTKKVSEVEVSDFLYQIAA